MESLEVEVDEGRDGREVIRGELSDSGTGRRVVAVGRGRGADGGHAMLRDNNTSVNRREFESSAENV